MYHLTKPSISKTFMLHWVILRIFILHVLIPTYKIGFVKWITLSRVVMSDSSHLSVQVRTLRVSPLAAPECGGLSLGPNPLAGLTKKKDKRFSNQGKLELIFTVVHKSALYIWYFLKEKGVKKHDQLKALTSTKILSMEEDDQVSSPPFNLSFQSPLSSLLKSQIKCVHFPIFPSHVAIAMIVDFKAKVPISYHRSFLLLL